MIVRLRISLNDIEPEIWRTVERPSAGSLKLLHDILQAPMSWESYYLWRCKAGDRRYGMPNPEWPDHTLAAAKNMKLGSLLAREICQITYTSNMGDGCPHTIVVEEIEPAKASAICRRFVAGERCCPLEEPRDIDEPAAEGAVAAVAKPLLLDVNT